MLMHNLKFAFRSLVKNRLFTVFNVLGFSVALAVCIIVSLFLYREYSVDSFYRNADSVYRLVDLKNNSVEIDRTVASTLKELYPEIEYAVPLFYFHAGEFRIFLKHPLEHSAVKLNGIISTTNDFFRLSNLKTIEAQSEEPFSNIKSVVLSKSVAIKLFGKTDILGELVKLNNADLFVSAVVEDIPINSSLKSDIYVHTDNPEYKIGSTCSNGNCFLRRNIMLSLSPGTDVGGLIKKMSGHFPENKTHTSEITLQPLRSIYFAPVYKGNSNETGNTRIILVILTIAVLTLLMSIVNYLNFSISKQLTTLKDSGVKITNGAGIGHLRIYYITEVGLVVFISLLSALLISWLVLPYSEFLFNEELNFNWLFGFRLLLPMLAVLLLVIITASLASVTFISRLTPQVLMNRVSVRVGKLPLRKLLTIGQLAVSVVLVTCLMFINKQLKYVKTADVGFNKEMLLRIDIPWGFKSYENIKSVYSTLPFVSDICLTSHTPGAGWSKNGGKTESGKHIEVNTVNIDDNFLKTFGLKILNGRDMMNSDLNNACFVSQSTVKQMEWENIEGKEFNGYQVIGVVNDINMNSLHTDIVPVAYFYTKDYFSAINLKLLPANKALQMEQIKRLWKGVLPDEPMTFGFYDEYYNSLYQKEDRQAQALTAFSIIAVIITCLGILGQIMQTSERRIKEIGIRKINGASIPEVMTLLNREFILAVFAAVIPAIPIAWFSMHHWLQNFAYKTELSWWVFALAGLLALGIALLTVSWQSWKAATRNPVEALRYE